MKIGLDFDGVITDCGRLKSEGAKKLYNVYIPHERFKKELVVDKFLTLEQYLYLQKQIYDKEELGLRMIAVDGALEYINKLQNKHILTVVTSRNKAGVEIAEKWMKSNGISIPIIGVNGNDNKSKACKGLDTYIDDDLDKLEPLINVVRYRFLFSWGYNQHIKVPLSIAKRIESWKQFYQEISK